MADLAPPAPTRQELAAILARVADSEPLLADRPVAELVCGTQRLDLACGWRLQVWWAPGEVMGPLFAATAPDGGRWSYGCDRWPNWLAGSEAVVLDPLTHLLTPNQRARLRARLLSCSCWPARETVPWYPDVVPRPWTDEELAMLAPS